MPKITVQEEEAVDPQQEQAQLLSFLYACPVGLLEMSADGTIGMINPLAMQLLLRLSPVLSMNFLHVLESYAPEIRNLKTALPRRRARSVRTIVC